MKKLAPVLLAALALTLPGAAHAADSHAPKGARADWLPSSEWLMSSWLPYDEARLHALLRTDRDELRGWLDDRRSIGDLARRRGRHSLRALAVELVGPRLRLVSPRMRHVLVARALDTLTQPHLARHVVFHVFHTPAIPQAARSIFGVSTARFRALRDSGTSPKAIGAKGGRSAARVRSALDRLFVARGRRAVALGAMSRGQGAALLREQRADLAPYVARAYRTPAQQLDFICHL